MLGSATLTTVLSRKTRADPSTVTVSTQRPSDDDTRNPSPLTVVEYPKTPDGQRDVATTILGSMKTETKRTVADVMLRRPKTLPADVTVAEARASLEKASVKMLLLVDGSRFSGAVTAIPEGADSDAFALDFAEESPPTATADMPVAEALERLRRRPNGRLVVLDGEDLAGLVCLTSDGRDFCGI
jgi:CBS domain-containing protein